MEINCQIDSDYIIFCPIFSERALKVLNSAKEMVKSLEEADEAQKKAKQAIAQANDDITSAKNDLEEVNPHLLKQTIFFFSSDN